jgi:hypothetical protein
MTSKRKRSTRPDPGGPFYLAAWMDALNISDRQLFELLEVSQPAVSRWRSGTRVPRRFATTDGRIGDPIVAIAAALTRLSGTKVLPSDLWTSPKNRRFNSQPMRKTP